MLANSKDKKLLPLDNFQFEMKNNKLYEDGWLPDMQSIMYDCSMSFKSFVRLDIAVDGGDYFEVYDKWRAKELDKVGRAGVTVYLKGKGDYEGYGIGKSRSKKKVVCYNKSADIRKKNKWYIEKFWQRCELSRTKNVRGQLEDVQRCEMRINNEEGRKFKGIDWTKLDDVEHLASIMQANLEGFYEWAIPDKGKNISRKKRFTPIDWDSLGATYLEKDSTRPTEELWAGKIAAKKLFELHIVTKQKHWLHSAMEIVLNLDALEWFKSRVEEWQDDIEKKLTAVADGGAAPTWLTAFKEYNENEQISIFDKQTFDSLRDDILIKSQFVNE